MSDEKLHRRAEPLRLTHFIQPGEVNERHAGNYSSEAKPAAMCVSIFTLRIETKQIN